MIIAVDGQAGSGKGTLAKGLAQYFNYAYLDTGVIYRALGYKANMEGVALDDEDKLAELALILDESEFSNPKLRSEIVASYASKVSQYPKVRKALLDYQQNFAKNPPNGFDGVVLDGRDIGTTICPDADAKIFVTASLKERTRRRIKDLQERGIVYDADQILEDIQERDQRDAGRAESPMKAAKDAWILDTSNMGINDVLAAGVDYIRSNAKK
ncbi:MAG: (d)CMP kinase [Alphaproteobacteria bacterium]